MSREAAALPVTLDWYEAWTPASGLGDLQVNKFLAGSGCGGVAHRAHKRANDGRRKALVLRSCSMHDALLGRVLFVFIAALFGYTTLWLIVSPFIEEKHAVLRLFPSVAYAHLPLTLVGVVMFSTIVGYIGILFIKEGLAAPRTNKVKRGINKQAS